MSVKPLTVTEVKGMKPREKDYAVYDGFGLLLNVSKAGGKVWWEMDVGYISYLFVCSGVVS